MTRRVLYFHHGGAIGGAPLSLLYLLERIDRTQYEPIVVTLSAGPVSRLYEAAGIETHVCEDIAAFSHTELEWYGGRQALWRLPLQAAKYPASVRAARRVIQRFRPALVHLNSSTLAAAARAARREGVPVVWHIREPLAAGYLGVRRTWLQRRVSRDAAAVIAISTHDSGRLRASPKTKVVYNFVDFARFDRRRRSSSAKTAQDIARDRPVVVMLGGTAAAKGTLTFVRAAQIVCRDVPNALFVIAGRPPSTGARRGAKGLIRRALGIDAYDDAVSAASAALVAAGQLRFAGIQEDVVPLLASADALVFPAAVPHFGRPLIEAAAMGLPAIASSLGSASEVVVDAITGHLVPPSNPPALARAVLALLSDPRRAAAMGEAAYLRARRLFDADVNARATFDVYREVLG